MLRHRRYDRIQPRSVRQACVDHWRGEVQSSSQVSDHPLHRGDHVLTVTERAAGGFQVAATLDVDLVERVDDNLADSGIAQKRLEWSKTQDLVRDLCRNTCAAAPVDRGICLEDA